MMENKCYMSGNTSDLNLDLMDDDCNVLVHKEICEECFVKLTTEKISPDKVLSVVIEELPELEAAEAFYNIMLGNIETVSDKDNLLPRIGERIKLLRDKR